MDFGFLAISDLGRSAGEVREDAATAGVSHVVLIEGEQPLAVLSLAELGGSAPAIGGLIHLGDQLEPAPSDIELGAGLTAVGLYVGEDFAVDMSAGAGPVVLLGEGPGHAQLLGALRMNSFTLVMADSTLPGPRQPRPPRQVRLRCPVGPHAVRVNRGTTTCPEHGELLSQ